MSVLPLHRPGPRSGSQHWERHVFCKRSENIHLGFLAPSALSEHPSTPIQVHCFYFSIWNGSTLPAVTLQPLHSSAPAHPTTHPPRGLVYNVFRRHCGFSWTWWELGAFSPIENTVQSNIKIIWKESSWFSTPERFCFQTPEYIVCKGRREYIRYVNINIYEINPEVSTLLSLWMPWRLFHGG